MEKNDRASQTFGTRFLITLLIILIIGQGLGFIFFTLSIRSNLINSINEQRFNQIMLSAIIGQGISLITTIIAISVLFIRNIGKPISDMSTVLSKMGTGDLSPRHFGTIQPIKSPVVPILTKGLNSLIVQLRNTILKLHSTTSDVTSAIKQIKLHIDKIADDTNNQFVSTEKMILILKSVEAPQKKILDSTYNFSKFLEENMSSLTQINSTIEEITENTEQFFKSLNNIYSTIAEMSTLTKEISKETGDLLASTNQSIVSIAEMTANLKEIEKGTEESANLTSRVRKIASDMGMLTVADAMEGMEDIADSVNKSFELVSRLGAKSKDIEKILSVITNVTKQTNLLSLNAAILAEQAGEYGKGFSVIADEIKTLSDKTTSSAKDIADIINTLWEEIASTISVTKKNAQMVKKGSTLIVKTGEAFREVIDAARKSDEMAKMIQRATEDQVKAVTQINILIEMMQMAVEHITKTASEQLQKSEQILSVEEKLKDISELIKRSVEEQVTATHQLSKNFELENEDIKHIVDASSEQRKINEELILAADKIKTICYNTATTTQELTVSFNKLQREAETLKKDMEGFRFE